MTIDSPSPGHPFTYRFSGLTLTCNMPLSQLPALPDGSLGTEAGIHVCLSDAHDGLLPASDWFMSSSLPDGEPWLSCAKQENGYLLRFHGLADFLTDREGQHVLGQPCLGTPPETLHHLLLNQTLPLVLSLRSIQALHATAVLTPHGVCAFTGPSGAGKSTLAASFALAGYPILSDDCLVVQERQGQILAVPASPGVRLWDDVREALNSSHHPALPVAHYTSKQRLVLPDHQDFPTAPEPLARIFCLRRDDEQADRGGRIEPLSRRVAFMELLQGLFTLDITDRLVLQEQLSFLAQMVSLVPVRLLKLPNDLSALSSVRETVLLDVAGSELGHV
ncbi:MAG: hypothetical protein FJ245_11605 [Nitrospira sp.]|nr:hypothetical protein [Nitrospira sp.]